MLTAELAGKHAGNGEETGTVFKNLADNGAGARLEARTEHCQLWCILWPERPEDIRQTVEAEIAAFHQLAHCRRTS